MFKINGLVIESVLAQTITVCYAYALNQEKSDLDRIVETPSL